MNANKKIFRFRGAVLAGLALGAAVLCGPAARVQAASAGSSTANFLKVDVGGRASAMAGNQFGAERDSFAQFYNPALLSNLSQKEIGFMHNQFFQEMKQDVLTYAHPSRSYGNFALALNYFSYGTIAGYASDGTPKGDIAANDILLGTSWGRKWDFDLGGSRIENLSTGVSAKFLQKKLHDKSAMGYMVDLGFGYQVEKLPGLRFAGTLQNLGTGLKFESETNPFPRLMKLGSAYSFWGNALTLALDGILPSDGSFYAATALEYNILRMFDIRVGYNSNKSYDKNLTYGVGFENPRFRLDYAFVPFGDLGDTHRVSALFRFGRDQKTLKADTQLKEKLKEAKTVYAQGQLVDAYMLATQIQHVAPWYSDNNKFIAVIQKDFRELEDNQKKAEILAQVTSIFNKGEKFFEDGNLINARLEFQAVLGLQPNHKAAQGYLKQIEGQFQSFVESFYRNGMIAFAAENYERAKEEFEKVLVIKPDHVEAKNQLARCNQVLDKMLREAAAAQQKGTISKTLKDAITAFKKENYDEAISLFREVLKMDPQSEEAQRYINLCKETIFKRYIERGKEFAARGEWEAALKNFRNAVDNNPSSREAKLLLEDVERKWELQRKVLSENLYKDGLEAFLNGDKKKAKSAWQKAVDLDPDNEEAKRGLARIAP